MLTAQSTDDARIEYTYDSEGKTKAVESQRINSEGILDKEKTVWGRFFFVNFLSAGANYIKIKYFLKKK